MGIKEKPTPVQVEKGIPIPNISRRGAKPKYPWSEMEVGDSFFIPGATANSHTGLVYNRSKRGEGVFTIRVVEGGARVWRIE